MTPFAKGGAGTKKYPPRVGGARPSQFMYSAGVGALFDLPNFSVIVAGLDDWDETNQVEIVEDRLLAAVRAESALGLSGIRQLRSVPWLEETRTIFDQWAWVGVPVFPFPRWLRCSACNVLTSIDGGLLELKLEYRVDRARWVHNTCTKTRGRPPTAVPARFVVACPDGHIDDFPWVEYVHLDTGGICPNGDFKLRAMDTGTGSRSTDLLVECLSCGKKRRMTNAFNENAKAFLPQCRGRHAHLREFDSECARQVRPLLLGASNAWFAATRSVLSIPRSTDPFEDAVAAAMTLIDDPTVRVESEDDLKAALKFNPRLAPLKLFPLNRVWTAIESRREGTPDDGSSDVLAPEWDALTKPNVAHESRDFRLQPTEQLPEFAGIRHVVQVDRLRAVIALCGFTRIDGPDSGVADDADEVAYAPLSRRKSTWIPAAETRGEGIFIRLDEETVAAWVRQVTGGDQMENLRQAHYRWRRRRGLADVEFGWPGERYVLIHSLAHALIHELALECGYSTASIRERIYAREPGSDRLPMAGVLLYTAAPDSEGTLGGLAALAQPAELARLLSAGLRRAELCSSDPMCAGHRPAETESSLHNAACHACLFLPETSCERANRYLDRSVLVPTLAQLSVNYPFRR